MWLFILFNLTPVKLEIETERQRDRHTHTHIHTDRPTEKVKERESEWMLEKKFRAHAYVHEGPLINY